MSDCTNCGEYCGHSHPDTYTGDRVAAILAAVEEAARYAFGEGHVAGANEVAVILMDLIAELRAINGDSTEAEYSVDVLADRAEARLREVKGDE